jgi:hypothetical protein
MAGQRTTQLRRPDGDGCYTFQAGHAGSIPVARSRRTRKYFEGRDAESADCR